jgi:hypothetical protein
LSEYNNKKTNKLSSFFDGDILCWWHFPRYTGLWNSISQCLFWGPVRTPLPHKGLLVSYLLLFGLLMRRRRSLSTWVCAVSSNAQVYNHSSELLLLLLL